MRRRDHRGHSQTLSQPLAAGEAGWVAGGEDSISPALSSEPRAASFIPMDERRRGPAPAPELKCSDYTDVIRVCVAEDSPHQVRGSVTAYGGNYQVAVSLMDPDAPLSPERVENAFRGALRHIEQLIARYGPEGNVPPASFRSHP